MSVMLSLPTIVVDPGALSASTDRDPFDVLGYEMLARAGLMSEQVIASVQRATPRGGLTLDQAVIGGLLVRCSKLTRGVFDATQADESEAHLVLSRCAAETAITLRWLVAHGNTLAFRRFRADSFAYWRGELQRLRSTQEAAGDRVDDTPDRVAQYVEQELDAAGIGWDDVPRSPNSWGPDMRQRCRSLDEEWIYDSLFASHSNYVHPSWHEIRTFHVKSVDGAIELDMTFGGIAPIGSYVIARLVSEACGAALERLPSDLDLVAAREHVANTVRASQLLAIEFHNFMARCGFDDELARRIGEH